MNLKRTYEKLQENNDSRGLYRLTKKKMGWINASTPQSFLIDGKWITNPRQMAELQASHYKDKVQKLVNQLPPQMKDPLSNLRDAFARWGRRNQITKMELEKSDCGGDYQIN